MKNNILEQGLKSATANGHAPGRSDREGISIIELFEMFPDNKTAEKWFESILWEKDARPCPYCGSPETILAKHNKKSTPYRCNTCYGYFSVKTGTVMHRSKIGYQKWAIAIYMFATSLKGVSSMKLHRELHITQKTAWFMMQRIRESWKTLAGSEKMQGPVEIDEMYAGGSESNKHKDKKGKVKKAIIVGIKDRKSNKITTQIVPEATKARLEDFIEKNVNSDSKKYTDENPSYSDLTNHESVKHSAGEYVRGMEHTNGMESFWSMMRRGYDGTFHHISKEHLHRYVNEFAGRYNIRPQNTDQMMSEITNNMSGKRLMYKQLITNGMYANRMHEMELKNVIN